MVLVDVGASLEVHADFLAFPGSIVVAFDADDRELPRPTASQHRVGNRAVVPPEAIIDGRTYFTLTQNPTLSSTLEPDLSVAGGYSLARRLNPIRKVSVPATTLEAALHDEKLDRIDWLKLDTQGTDGRLVSSLPTKLLDQIMCVDVEPGTDAFYRGEDTFESVHALMRKSGFWLATLETIDAARISRRAFDALMPVSTPLLETAVDISLSGRYRSPVAVNARYLRDPETANAQAGAEGLKRLWLCAMASDLLPFAFEVAHSAKESHPCEEFEQLLLETRRLLRLRMVSPILLIRKVNASRIRRTVTSHF